MLSHSYYEYCLERTQSLIWFKATATAALQNPHYLNLIKDTYPKQHYVEKAFRGKYKGDKSYSWGLIK